MINLMRLFNQLEQINIYNFEMVFSFLFVCVIYTMWKNIMTYVYLYDEVCDK